LLKEKRAIRLTTEGKNAGCWIMDLPEESETEEGSDEKVIVRSNGTVTYVGKDIAYQMWKLGILDKDFAYEPFREYDDGTWVWSTTSSQTKTPPGVEMPKFGHGDRVYNVIDTRQSYLQRIVQQGVALLASEQARERSRHFAYEMVALTPSTCLELGFPITEEEAKKPYLEVSGRKGLGVKADDLIDLLERKALEEVKNRNSDESEQAQKELASAIAKGALRYFMIKTTKNKVIAFDFAEALSFEGDSGPYLQYAMVRAGKIVQKMGLDSSIDRADEPPENMSELDWDVLSPEESDELWSLSHFATRLGYMAEQVRRTEEPAHLARFALQLAQKFNAFYHRYPILKEEDPGKQALRLFVVQVFRRQMSKALGLMGIPIPERM
jgi:arginyl-tRNA synthetase